MPPGAHRSLETFYSRDLNFLGFTKVGKFIREVYFKKYIVGTGNVKSLNGQGEYFHVMVTLVDENDVFNAP